MTLTTSPGRQLPPDGEPSRPEDRQRQRLILALVLFVAAIGVVIYKLSASTGASQPAMEASLPAVPPEPTPGATDLPAETSTASSPGNNSAASVGAASAKTASEAAQHGKHKTGPVLEKLEPAAETAPAPVIQRKVLPPLNVEVFAGGRPVPLQSKPTVAVHVDTSNGVQGRAAASSGDTTVPAGDPSNPGRVRISPEALQVLSHPVDPNYPLLAREMKVQGSVILDAYIGRDGTIQALKIVSGPTILATAAMEAVRQWRFKPYLQAGQAVETEARITVNFTISTT